MSTDQLQTWSREVAEDPGAPSFVRLARAYRRQGRRSVAREVLLRGLERRPEHLAAHSLLAMIHVEEGDHEQARDEWETVLRLEPCHFDAALGLGLLAIERNDLDEARRCLDTADTARPGHPTIADAREVLERRDSAGVVNGGPAPPDPAPRSTEPERVGWPALRHADRPIRRAMPGDPASLFAPLMTDPSFLGALVLDAQGLVLAGGIEGSDGSVQALLGGSLNAVVGEAHRTAALVRLGAWRELLVEAEGAMLHVAPLAGDGVVVVVARPDTQAGWVMRLSGRARELARRFLEVTA